MKYMLLIYAAEDSGPKTGSPEWEADMGGYFAFTDELVKAGAMVAGAPLEGAHTATTVRVRNGKSSVIDGPFAETKEVLGGYYIVESANLDEALAWAAKIPGAKYGSIEVRPVMDIPGA